MSSSTAQALSDAVRRVVAQFPPLTDEQLERIAALLRAGARQGGDDDAAA